MEREMDYQKSYLEERIRSCRVESQALQLQFQLVQVELANTQKELAEYQVKKDKENDSIK